jgi:hypothetical protein
MFYFAHSLTGLCHNRKTSCLSVSWDSVMPGQCDIITDIVWPWSVGYFAPGVKASVTLPLIVTANRVS